jgi:catechol 2,3-dioxygenase-like lactoylglutathione lyase family enzyme
MLELFQKPAAYYHVNPRFRAYGKARIDIAQRAATRDDWDRLWKKSTFPFPFSWGQSWKQCIEYRVADFAAEVGFFIDILGFPVNAFDPDYAMFTSPNGEFFFSVVPAHGDEESTPPDAIRLQFMVAKITETAVELERRGVVFEHWPAPAGEDSPLQIGSFRTPHGIGIDLWGIDADQDRLEVDQQLELEEDTIESPSVSIKPDTDEGRDNDDSQLNIFTEDSSADLLSSADALVEDLSDGSESSELEYVTEDESE